jgi:hypothetical protein
MPLSILVSPALEKAARITFRWGMAVAPVMVVYECKQAIVPSSVVMLLVQ